MEISWNIETIGFIVLGIVCLVETLILLLIFQCRQTVTELIKTTWSKTFSLGIILTTDNKIALRAPTISASEPDRWEFDKGGVIDGKRLIKGHSGTGPDRIEYALFTEEGMESINLRNKEDSELAGTSGYLQKTIDLSYDNGYNDGFDASHNKSNLLPWVSQNWHILIIFFIVAGIGFTIAYDKMYTGPEGWQIANACEQSKASMIARCSPYVDLSNPITVASNNTLAPSPTGGVVR